MTGVFTRRRKETQREESHVKSEAEIGYKLRNVRGFQKLEEARKGPSSPGGFRESTALSAP